MKRKFFLIKLDETDRWHDDGSEVLPLAGRIFGTYLTDLSVGYNLCELARSYELEFVGSQWEGHHDNSEENNERIDEYIGSGDAQTEPLSYVHCSDVHALPTVENGLPPKGQRGCKITLDGLDNTDDNDEDAREGIMEYLRCNQM